MAPLPMTIIIIIVEWKQAYKTSIST